MRVTARELSNWTRMMESVPSRAASAAAQAWAFSTAAGPMRSKPSPGRSRAASWILATLVTEFPFSASLIPVSSTFAASAVSDGMSSDHSRHIKNLHIGYAEAREGRRSAPEHRNSDVRERERTDEPDIVVILACGGLSLMLLSFWSK